MFRRRTSPTLPVRLRDMFWPRIGWGRFSRYAAHRVGRIPGTPYNIAAGLACGAAASCTPFIGGHFVLGAVLAVLMRGSVIASAVGTFVGNPWTFPLIWLSIHRLGSAILGRSAEGVDFVQLFSRLWSGLLSFDVARLIGEVWPVFWPMVVGSLPVALAVWVAVFWPARRLIHGYQQHRRRRRMAGARRRAASAASKEETS